LLVVGHPASLLSSQQERGEHKEDHAYPCAPQDKSG
jgi:hypothetical protein